MIRALVVDDEEHARRGIINRLGRFPDIEIAGACANGREAIDAIRQQAPDLVFLDVRMPGKDGFDVIEAIGANRFPLVIFVTAYDQHALRAFEVHAVDYLLKPIDDERFAGAIARARELLAQRDNTEFRRRLSELMHELERPAAVESPETRNSRLLVRSGGRIVLVPIADIDWVAATGDYVTLHTGKTSSLMRETISAIEKQLVPHGFVRIHRSILVNRERIAELRYQDNGDYRVLLRDGTELKLSRSHQAALKDLLNPPAPR